jgi:hypothetical protein
VIKIKILPHLQYENLYDCNVSLTIRKSIDNAAINFIINYSSKSNYVRKVYKTKLGIYTQPNNMDGCLQFSLMALNIFTLSENFFWAKTFHLFTIIFGHASSVRHILSEIPSISAQKPMPVFV